MDIKEPVNFGEGAGADGDDLVPEGEVFGVAGLQFDQFAAYGVEDGGIGFSGSVGGFVDPLEFFERIGGERGGIEEVFITPDQFAELGAPVADVIIADDFGAAEGEEPTNGFAYDHATDVANMQLFGGVG